MAWIWTPARPSTSETRARAWSAVTSGAESAAATCARALAASLRPRRCRRCAAQLLHRSPAIDWWSRCGASAIACHRIVCSCAVLHLPAGVFLHVVFRGGGSRIGDCLPQQLRRRSCLAVVSQAAGGAAAAQSWPEAGTPCPDPARRLTTTRKTAVSSGSAYRWAMQTSNQSRTGNGCVLGSRKQVPELLTCVLCGWPRDIGCCIRGIERRKNE